MERTTDETLSLTHDHQRPTAPMRGLLTKLTKIASREGDRLLRAFYYRFDLRARAASGGPRRACDSLGDAPTPWRFAPYSGPLGGTIREWRMGVSAERSGARAI